MLISTPEKWQDRLLVRLHGRQLDVALANGIPAETSPALALRARRLTRLQRRRRIAETILGLLDGGGWHYLRVSPLRGRVEAASGELTRLAGHLAGPAPVSARGVAQTVLLLTDGTGPLYNPGSAASIGERARTALSNLELA